MFVKAIKLVQKNHRLWLFFIMLTLSGAAAIDLSIHFTGLSRHPHIEKELYRYFQLEKDVMEHIKPTDINTLGDFYIHQVERVMQYYGYFNSKVTTNLQDLNEDHYRLVVNIIPQYQMTVDQIVMEVIGESELKVDDLMTSLAMKEGDVFQVPVYESDKNELLRYLDNHGYVRSDLEQTMVFVEPSVNQAKVRYVVRLGRRFRFGDIKINDNKLDQKFIKAFAPMTIETGAVYSGELLDSWYSHLAGSPYFKNITIEPDLLNMNEETNQIDIHVQVQNDKFMRSVIGVGYDTLDFFYANYLMQLQPLTKYGHLLSWLVRYNQNRKLHSELVYTIPSINNPVNQRSDIRAFLLPSVDYVGGTYEQKKFEFNQYQSMGDLSLSLALGMTDEYYNHFAGPRYHTVYPYIRGHFLHDRWLPNYVHWLKKRIIIDVETSLQSKNNFQKVFMDLGNRIDYDYFSIENNFKLGRIFSSDNQNLALSNYFSLGSSNGLRGYGTHAIGPGLKVWSNQLELQKSIGGNDTYIYGFFDVGQISNKINLSDSLQSFGLGFLYRSQLEFDVKFDIAHPVGGRGIKVNFSVEKVFG